MTGLSAVLITLDEAERLPAALASLAFCDEVVVVDAGSRDATRELAEARGARVVVSAPWPGWVAQRRLAVEVARHDWVLALDADERVGAALRAEIEALRRSGYTAAGYRMPRVASYLGRSIRGTDWADPGSVAVMRKREKFGKFVLLDEIDQSGLWAPNTARPSWATPAWRRSSACSA